MAPFTLRKSATVAGGGCLAIFGLPFFAAGMFMAWLNFSALTDWWRARDWEETPCRIESVDLQRNDDTSKVVASYSYRFRGRDYRSDRVSLVSGADNVGDFQQNAFRELSAHRKGFRCFVNPAEAVIYRKIRWPLHALMAIFPLTFPAVGAGLMIGGIFGSIGAKREIRLRSQFPAEPWKWKPAWVASAIPERAAHGWSALYTYTVWSAAVIFPLIAAMVSEGVFSDLRAFFGLIYPALWSIPAWLSLKRIRHRMAVGHPSLDLSTRPIQPGGPLNAYLLLTRPLPSRATAQFTLISEKSTTQETSDGNSTHTEKLWSHQESVSADRILRDITGFRLPVPITLPADALECGRHPEADGEISWKLEFAGPGTPIRSEFDLPVFRTGPPP